MGSFLAIPTGIPPSIIGQIQAATSNGPLDPMFGVVYGKQRLPEDAIGTFTLRLKNIVRGSRYRIEIASTGALIDTLGEGTVAAGTGETTDVDITLPLYVAGSANNDLRIKARKGTSSPFYKDFETLATSQSGTVISYIGQISDE